MIVATSTAASTAIWAESAAGNPTQREAAAAVYRRVGADGVVEFNDYGAGDEVVLEVAPPLGAADVELVKERQRDILDVARVLADDRSDREEQRQAERDALREDREQAELDRLAALNAAESVYFPARLPLFSPFQANRLTNFNRRRASRRKFDRSRAEGTAGPNGPGGQPPAPSVRQLPRTFIPGNSGRSPVPPVSPVPPGPNRASPSE